MAIQNVLPIRKWKQLHCVWEELKVHFYSQTVKHVVKINLIELYYSDQTNRGFVEGKNRRVYSFKTINNIECS